jgi:hypothetical protein
MPEPLNHPKLHRVPGTLKRIVHLAHHFRLRLPIA